MVGEQAEGGGVRFGKTEAGKAGDHFEDLGGVGFVYVRPARHRSLDEAAAVRFDRLSRTFAAHCAAQPCRLGGAETGEGHRHFDHLILKDDRAERLTQDRLQRVVRVRDFEVGVCVQRLAPLDVRVDGAALDWPRPDDRYLNRYLVKVCWARAPQ